MKNLFLLQVLLIFAGKLLQAQTNDTIIHKDTIERVFAIVEKMPLYPDSGDAGLKRFLQMNIKYPHEELANHISGTVYITFVIDSTGKIKDEKLLRGVSTGLDKEALRVVSMMPNWIPGSQNGRKVSVQFNMPIKFNIDDSYSSKSGKTQIIYVDTPIKNEKAIKFYNIGVEYLNKQQYEKAIDFFDKTLLENNKDKDAYYNRGVAHHKLNHTTESCDDWNKCKQLGDKEVEELIQKYCK